MITKGFTPVSGVKVFAIMESTAGTKSAGQPRQEPSDPGYGKPAD
jgi:hypothetical protein